MAELCIYEERETHVLSLQSAWGVTGLGSLLIPSVSAGSFLICSLVVRCCVFLAQLLFQVVILSGEVFHGSSKSFNLSLEGSRGWFFFLNVVNGCH